MAAKEFQLGLALGGEVLGAKTSTDVLDISNRRNCMLEEHDDVMAELREIRRRMKIEAGNDFDKFTAARDKWAREYGIVYADVPNALSPKSKKLLAESRARRAAIKAARMKKIDTYLAKRAARTAAAKSA